MRNLLKGIHLYVNINNLNSIIKSDENNHENLCRTFHALNTFTWAMEKFTDELPNVEVEKFTTSRLHFYITEKYGDSETISTTMLEIVAFAQSLSNHINKLSKYQSLIDFKIGAGADYGEFTEFKFEDPKSGIEEMTTIGSPANRAAKLQSLCENGSILISKEVYNILPAHARCVFFGEAKATAKLAAKYADLSAYKSTINDIYGILDDSYKKHESRCLDYATEVANKLNLGDMDVTEAKSQIDFTSLSLQHSKTTDDAVILFSDIRNFTKTVDEENLAEIKQLTQQVLEMMNKQVRDRDGVHVQFQGDRESAVFNKFSGEKNDYAMRAVLCAMRMLDKIAEINKNRHGKELDIGIGCALGTIFATRIGIRGRKFNVVMGQTVKEADDAEDNIAGANINSPKTEIAITEDMFKYLINLSGKEAKLIKQNFKERKQDNKVYYVSTLSFSEFQDKLNSESLQQNASRADNNKQLKPWGHN